MFTIFGVTGHTGSVIARELLARGEQVRVVARTPEKAAELAALGAEIVSADVLDRASLEAALRDAEGAFLLNPPALTSDDFIARSKQVAQNYAAALTATKVPHVVYLSSIGAQLPSGTGPIVTAYVAEQTLGTLPNTRVTFVRAPYFMENVLGFAHPMQQDGVLPVFGGGEAHAFDMVATQDIARVAIDALLAPPAATEVVELDGPQQYSFADAATEASRVLGRKVTATPLPIDAMVPALTGLGMSPNVAGLFREMTVAIGSGLVKHEGRGRKARGTTRLGDVLSALRA